MAYVLGEPTVQQYFDANGDPLVSGTIEFYVADTTTPATVYSDDSGTAIGTSVTLSSLGAPLNGNTAVALFFDSEVSYKIIRKDSAGIEIEPTIEPYIVGGGVTTDSTIAQLKARSSALGAVFVSGHTTEGDGGGGNYWLDASDTTSADNGGTVIVGNDGTSRWKLIHNGSVSIKQFGAVQSANDTTAVQNALDSGVKEIYVPPGTYPITSVTLSEDNVRIYGPGTLQSIGSTGAVNLLEVTGDGCSVDGICIDLQNSTDTFADGFVADRNGLYVHGASNASYMDGFTSRDLRVKNCGQSAVYMQYVDDVMVTGAHIERCGQHGFRLFSVSNVTVENSRGYRIRPGNTGTSPYLNAYFLTFSRSGSDNVPEDCEVRDCYAEDVTTWEGFDVHFGKRVRFHNCSTLRCNQGVAIESTTAGAESEDIQIIGGTHTSYGQAYVWDTETFEPSGAIIANMGSTTTNGSGLLITGVVARGHGSGRNSSGGAIIVQDAEDVVVTNNLLIDSLKRGIALRNETQNCFVYGNAIHGVVSVGSLSRGITKSSTESEFSGRIYDNLITGTTNQTVYPVEVTVSSGAVTPIASFQIIDGEGDLADDLDTINGGIVGETIRFSLANAGRVVTFKHAVDNIRCVGAADIVPSGESDIVECTYIENEVWIASLINV